MKKENSDSKSNIENNWVPNNLDILNGSISTKEALKNIIAAGGEITPKLLGVLAGRNVLDQYYNAREHKFRLFYFNFSINNLKYFIAVLFPLLGFVAAIFVDIAVFEKASEKLSHEASFFNPFAFGALIFASLLGIITTRERVTKFFYHILVIFASFVASFIIADNENFRENFTSSLSSIFERSFVEEEKQFTGLQAEWDNNEKQIKDNNLQLLTGGDNGAPMDNDANEYNDDIGRYLEEKNKELKER